MKKLFFLGLLLSLVFPLFAQLNTSLESTITYTPRLNDVWGYEAAGREYALVGLRNGVNIQDITTPSSPVDKGTATGPNSTWRDIKTYGTYAYVINESSQGLLIIDLSGLPTAITSSDWSYWEPDLTTELGGILSTCHNLYIDANGYAFLTGCNLNSGGIIIVDVFTDPENPSYVGKGPATYSHDVYVSGNYMYTSDIYDGKFTIYELSADRTATTWKGDQTTPDNFTHNTWTNGADDVIFTTDEVGDAPVAAYDIFDPTNITLLDEFRPLATINTGVVPHNVHVINDYLVISHYSDGVVIVDASVPSNLIEVGNYDTCTGSCSGAWGAYPFFSSGTIIVSDMNEGCFVLTPTYVRASRLKGKVTDLNTSANISGVKVTINDPQANEDNTDFNGNYKTGIAAAGTYSVTFEKAGYVTHIVPSIALTNGTEVVLNVQLDPGALAIDLISFDARSVAKDEVELSWKAASDDPFIHFTIERSTDGVQFAAIDQIEDRSPTAFAKDYSYSDLRVPKGQIFYRLKMVDPTGEATFSPVRSVDNFYGNQISIYPNPVKPGNPLTIATENQTPLRNLELEVYNSTGALVDQLSIEELKNLEYETAALPSGVYFLKFTAAGEVVQVERLTVE